MLGQETEEIIEAIRGEQSLFANLYTREIVAPNLFGPLAFGEEKQIGHRKACAGDGVIIFLSLPGLPNGNTIFTRVIGQPR